jgi:hypothetical protein
VGPADWIWLWKRQGRCFYVTKALVLENPEPRWFLSWDAHTGFSYLSQLLVRPSVVDGALGTVKRRQQIGLTHESKKTFSCWEYGDNSKQYLVPWKSRGHNKRF